MVICPKISHTHYNMEQIIQEINNCKKCELWKTRNKPLVGDGSLKAKIMFIGEAPGYYEDLQGRAFAGEAGKIFDKLLESINLRREEIYITNVLKCKLPKNRKPKREEIERCVPYLDRQIEIIKPKVIIPLGKFAAVYILKKYGIKEESIAQVHGKVFEVNNLLDKVKIIPLYHPAVVCYHEEMFEILKDDFKVLEKILEKGDLK